MEEETTKLGKFIYNLIDAMFWVADETARWWEISKITIQIKTFRRQKAALNKLIKENEQNSISISVNQTAQLTSLNESISKLAAKEDLLRSKCWDWTPLFYFSLILLLFFYGVISINPIQQIVDSHRSSIGVFGGQISRVRELPLDNQSIISDSIWFNNKIYIAGNNGVTIINSVTGQAQNMKELPANFYAKDLLISDGKLIIAGYPGIFEYEQETEGAKPLFNNDKLPNKLINSIAVINEKKKQYLIGTLGKGIFRSSGDYITPVSQTENYIARSFGHQKKELWILHEEGILTGNSDKLANLDLQVLQGKKTRCMVTTDKNVFIGTDQGIVAGYRSSKNWVWTMLSSTKPGFINDIINAGEVLFIASDEGVFRYYKGKMDRLSGIPTYSLCLCDTFLAAVNKSSVALYYFNFSGNIGKSSIFGAIPELGTYTPTLPITSLPMEMRPSYSRMPDYGLLETDGKEALAESSLTTESYPPDQKPMVELPIELQRPVFSDITQFNNKYLLATTNRGIWSFDGKTWNQINHNGKGNANKLCCNSKHCYAYNSQSGIYEILDNIANLIIDSRETLGLKYLSICDEDTLLLLFNDGKVKKFKNGELELFFNIPSEFTDNCHSIWKIKDQYLAVLNQGIMTHESNGKWNLLFYQGNIDSARIADVVSINNQELYIALNDGRIFRYSENKLMLSGIISDHPNSINYSGSLWVSSIDSLYLKDKNTFTAIPFKSRDRILGAFPDKENKNIYVFTASGLRIINKQN